MIEWLIMQLAGMQVGTPTVGVSDGILTGIFVLLWKIKADVCKLLPNKKEHVEA